MKSILRSVAASLFILSLAVGVRLGVEAATDAIGSPYVAGSAAI